MKKILSAILVAAMLLSTMGMVAFAANNVAKLGDIEYPTLQEAINAAVAGNNEIQLLPGTISEYVTVVQNDGINITIKGAEGVTFTGTIYVTGNGRMYGTETFTVDGVHFDATGATTSQDFITSEKKYNGKYSYPHNVTIQNCSFVGNDNYDVVAARNHNGRDWNFYNCTAKNLHSFLWATGLTGTSTLENITVTESKSGVSLGTNANYTVTNCTFDVQEHAVRWDANGTAANPTVTNCDIKAATGIVIRNEATAAHVATIENNKIISTSGQDILRVDSKDNPITNNDNITVDIEDNYWGGDAPAADAVADTFTEIPSYYTDENKQESTKRGASVGGAFYSSIESAIAAAEGTDTVYIYAGTYDSFDIPEAMSQITVEGETDANGNNLVTILSKADDNKVSAWHAFRGTAKNLTFKTEQGKASNESIDGMPSFDTLTFYCNCAGYASNATMIGCDFIGQGIAFGGDVDFKDCTFDGLGYGQKAFAYCVPSFNTNNGDGVISVDNCTFENYTFCTLQLTEGDVTTKLVVKDSEINGNMEMGSVAEMSFANTVIENTVMNVYCDSTVKIADDCTVDENSKVSAQYGTVTVEGNIKSEAIAKIGNKYYSTLIAAIADAKDNDTITLFDDTTIDTVMFSDITIVIDLNDHTLNVTNTNADGTTRLSFNDGADVTFKNGKIDITGAKESAGIFFANAYDSSNGIIRFDNVDIVGNGYDSGYAVFYANSDDSEIHFINGTTVTLSNEKGASGGVIKSEGNVAKIVIDDSTFVLDNIARGFVKANFTITDSDITIQNSHKTALRNFNGTIEDSVINVYNCDFGIESDNTAPLGIEVLGNSSVKMTGSITTDLYLANTNTAIKVADTAELIVETSSIPEGANVTGNVVSKADAIYVQFEKADVDATGADNEREKDIYDIVLVGANAEKINELASADLTFVFDGKKAVADGDLGYTIVSKEGVTLSQTGIKGQEDRYMFNFNGVNGSYEETGNKIVLGQVTIGGYGEYTFGMKKDATTNAVYATSIRDNLVEGFVTNATPAATLILDVDMDQNDTLVEKIDAEITVPVQKLTINVTFPNAVKTNNAKLYQDMQVKIEGGNIKTELALGDKTYTQEVGDLWKAEVKVTDTNYVVTTNLPYNTTYTVTVSGAGYRTATYSVVLTDDKELTFWNNVMDDDKEIEKNNANSKRTTSFLAGDIVKDNKINIYDLSAVVSYFGQIKLNEIEDGEDFAKYDLDRDGKIDAKDVAYVLVSWGN